MSAMRDMDAKRRGFAMSFLNLDLSFFAVQTARWRVSRALVRSERMRTVAVATLLVREGARTFGAWGCAGSWHLVDESMSIQEHSKASPCWARPKAAPQQSGMQNMVCVM